MSVPYTSYFFLRVFLTYSLTKGSKEMQYKFDHSQNAHSCYGLRSLSISKENTAARRPGRKEVPLLIKQKVPFCFVKFTSMLQWILQIACKLEAKPDLSVTVLTVHCLKVGSVFIGKPFSFLKFQIMLTSN